MVIPNYIKNNLHYSILFMLGFSLKNESFVSFIFNQNMSYRMVNRIGFENING